MRVVAAGGCENNEFYRFFLAARANVADIYPMGIMFLRPPVAV